MKDNHTIQDTSENENPVAVEQEIDQVEQEPTKESVEELAPLEQETSVLEEDISTSEKTTSRESEQEQSISEETVPSFQAHAETLQDSQQKEQPEKERYPYEAMPKEFSDLKGYTVSLSDEEGTSYKFNVVGVSNETDAANAAINMISNDLKAKEVKLDNFQVMDDEARESLMIYSNPPVPERLPQEQQSIKSDTFEKEMIDGLIGDIEHRGKNMSIEEADTFYVALDKLAENNYLSKPEVMNYTHRLQQHDPRTIERQEEPSPLDDLPY